MKPFIPNQLPIKNMDYARLFNLMGEANSKLALYDGLLQGIVNPSIMLSPLLRKEAELSSKIEGTQATANDVLEFEAGMKKEPETEHDIKEIINYRNALNDSYEYLKEGPISLPYIRSVHKTLLDSVRGKDKNPGEFRQTQNWIGPKGCKMEEATFVPPEPILLSEYLDNWQDYVRGTTQEPLLQIAIAHAQFEILHPFLDGNGRIGRILIPIIMYKKQKLSSPMFYLSEYLEANRDEYYERLLNVSQKGDWNSWAEFFYKAIISQADSNNKKVRLIMSLYEEMKEKITEITHSQYSLRILDFIFSRPIFSSSKLIGETDINRQTVGSLLKQLANKKIIEELQSGSGRRATVWYFPDLLKILG